MQLKIVYSILPPMIVSLLLKKICSIIRSFRILVLLYLLDITKFMHMSLSLLTTNLTLLLMPEKMNILSSNPCSEESWEVGNDLLYMTYLNIVLSEIVLLL